MVKAFTFNDEMKCNEGCVTYNVINMKVQPDLDLPQVGLSLDKKIKEISRIDQKIARRLKGTL